MRRAHLAVLALASLLQTGPGLTVAQATQTPIAPLPLPTGDQPKLTCADFRKSIVDGSWSATHPIKTPTLTLDTNAVIRRGETGGVDLVTLLEKDCATRRPS